MRFFTVTKLPNTDILFLTEKWLFRADYKIFGSTKTKNIINNNVLDSVSLLFYSRLVY